MEYIMDLSVKSSSSGGRRNLAKTARVTDVLWPRRCLRAVHPSKSAGKPVLPLPDLQTGIGERPVGVLQHHPLPLPGRLYHCRLQQPHGVPARLLQEVQLQRNSHVQSTICRPHRPSVPEGGRVHIGRWRQPLLRSSQNWQKKEKTETCLLAAVFLVLKSSIEQFYLRNGPS